VVHIDNSKNIDPLLLSVLVFVTNLFDNCTVLCLSYSIFFDKFIGLKIHIAIIFIKSLPMGFYAIEFIDIMGLNFFKEKFSIK
jgi:hypothetical protein